MCDDFDNYYSKLLNLIINGLPSIPEPEEPEVPEFQLLNLIINGLPSIL